MRKILIAFTFLLIAKATYTQTPCESGMVGIYPCNGIDLLSHISAQDLLAEEHEGIWLNDIWGWTDPSSGKEYALIGMSNGTSFVDVSDLVNPIFLGLLKEHNASGRQGRFLHDGAKSIWRDIKVYKNHAYIVSEDADHGMQVFDLTQLRGVTTPQTFTETAIYQGIGSAHNIVINESTGFAYAVGADTQDKTCTEGGLHIIDISSPASPVYAGCFDTDGYTHDAQCVIYNGPDDDYKGMEICFSANENSITLANVDDKDDISMISRVEYAGSQYAHQGWLTEDQRYFLTNDELDESRNGTNTKTLIWDMIDLDNPVLIGTHFHDGKAIDHNLYIVDDLVYQSNYTSGLRVMNLTNVAQGTLSETAYFDTYPSSDATSFDGAWSSYPFFSSGAIIVSDITNGLFVLKLSTPSVANFNFSIDEKTMTFENKSIYASSYEWDFGDGSPVSDLENPIHEYATGGSYEVKLTATNNDGSDELTRTVSSVNVPIPPTANFNFSIDANIVTFENLSTYATSYEWNFGDQSPVSDLENPMHEYEIGGSYEVKLIATNNDGSDESTRTATLVFTGLSPQSAFDNVNIYPNPASSQLSIKLGNETDRSISATLTDLQGKVFLQEHTSSNNTTFVIDIHKIPSGMYYLTLNSDKGTVTKKVIIN